MGKASIANPVNPEQVKAALSGAAYVIRSGTTTTEVEAVSMTDAAVASALGTIVYDSTVVDNNTTIRQRLTNHRTQLLSWIAANPNGAVLTAAQTLVLAQMLVDLTDADLGLLSDLSGT